MDQESSGNSIYNSFEAITTLSQIAQAVFQFTGLEISFSPNSRAFSTKSSVQTQKGILSVRGEITDDNEKIILKFEVLQLTGNLRIHIRNFLKSLSELSSKTRILPLEEKNGYISVSLALEIAAEPLSFIRTATLQNEIKIINNFSKYLQNELPASQADLDLERLYKGHDYLSVIYPYPPTDNDFINWSRDTADILSVTPMGIIGSPVVVNLMLAYIAHALKDVGISIARLNIPYIQVSGLVDLIRRAPGIVVVPAESLSVSSNRYDISNEMQGVLASITRNGNTFAIAGSSFEEVKNLIVSQRVYADDPLLPVVRRCPSDVPLGTLVEFIVSREARNVGGIGSADIKKLSDEITDSLAPYEVGDQHRMLPLIARRSIKVWDKGKSLMPTSDFVSKLSGLNESFSGVSSKKGQERSAEVQEKLLKAITYSNMLITGLKDKLLGQDEALEKVVFRLKQQLLSNSKFQPLSYLAQGTPGSGKSECARMIAEILDIPYINIDVSSAGDTYTLKSMLYGSARGLVGSDQPGRLQEAAAHRSGAVVEISDMDHTPAYVCSYMGDIFLSILETGQAQSATGVSFSCANIIFCFSFNLPGLKDQEVRRGGLGFKAPSHEDVKKSILSELQQILSPAFLSRIGSPIIFEPVSDPKALGEIARRTIKSALRSITEGLNIKIGEVFLDERVEEPIVEMVKDSILTFGVRALLEKTRSLTTLAFLELYKETDIAGKALLVSSGKENNLVIKLKED